MIRRRRTEVTVEMRELFIVGSAAASVRAWCAACGTDVVMVTPEAAAMLSGVSTRTIYAFVEARKIHFVETPAGLLLVCTDSLLKYR